MIQLGLYFAAKDIDPAVALLGELSAPLAPKYFSSEESIEDERDLLSDGQRFEEFQTHNRSGYILLSDRCTYNVTITKAGYSSVLAYPQYDVSETEIVNSFVTMAVANLVFGFAADEEERNHRNRLAITLGKNRIETWVGRRIENYIPGLYWRTAISRGLAREVGLDFNELPKEYEQVVIGPNAQIVLVKPFERAEEWAGRADEIDTVCSRVEGLFSIADVRAAAQGARSYMEYHKLTRKWR